MSRKRKQLQIYNEPDAKQARADSEGDFSENGMPWGWDTVNFLLVYEETVACLVVCPPVCTVDTQELKGAVCHPSAHSPHYSKDKLSHWTVSLGG